MPVQPLRVCTPSSKPQLYLKNNFSGEGVMPSGLQEENKGMKSEKREEKNQGECQV